MLVGDIPSLSPPAKAVFPLNCSKGFPHSQVGPHPLPARGAPTLWQSDMPGPPTEGADQDVFMSVSDSDDEASAQEAARKRAEQQVLPLPPPIATDMAVG